MKILYFLLIAGIICSCEKKAEEGIVKEKADGTTKVEQVEPDESEGISRPDNVNAAFMKKFPGADDVKWEKEGPMFEVEFTYEDNEFEAVFDDRGEWIETAQEIELENIPEIIKKAFETNYPGIEIDEAEIINSKDFSEVYKLEFTRNDKKMEVMMHKDGKVLEEKVEKEDKEDKKEKEDEEDHGLEDAGAILLNG